MNCRPYRGDGSQAVEASGSEFASTSSSSANQIMMERGPAVDEALKAVCGATGLMRPEVSGASHT